MKVLLHDLPNAKHLIGKRINVVSQGGEFHYDYQDIPMMRVFTGAKIVKDHGRQWINWYWESEIEEKNRHDCGWSGYALDKQMEFNKWLEVSND